MTPLAKKRLPSLRRCQRSSDARAAGGGGGELPLGDAGVAVFGGEDDGDALAQDLRLGVAEEVLGAGVPTDDPPVGVDA